MSVDGGSGFTGGSDGWKGDSRLGSAGEGVDDASAGSASTVDASADESLVVDGGAFDRVSFSASIKVSFDVSIAAVGAASADFDDEDLGVLGGIGTGMNFSWWTDVSGCFVNVRYTPSDGTELKSAWMQSVAEHTIPFTAFSTSSNKTRP